MARINPLEVKIDNPPLGGFLSFTCPGIGFEPCAERAEVRQIGRIADLDVEQSEAPEGALRVRVHA